MRELLEVPEARVSAEGGCPVFMQHGVHQDELSDDGLFTAVGLQFAIMASSKEIGCH